jgi:sugar lactone lactonase YvrE
VEILCRNLNELGEGPVWDPRTQSLFWVDILKKKVHQLLNHNINTWNTDTHVGAIALKEDSNLLLAQVNGFYDLNISSGQISKILTVDESKDTRFNDGKCDPIGRFWAGTMVYSKKEPLAAFYCLESNTQVTQIFNEVKCSNGLAWNQQLKKFYYIDTPLRRVDVFDYNDDNTELSNRQIAIDLKDETGFPDGCCIDAEGMLWIAFWGGSCVKRYHPQKGECIKTIQLPRVSKVTSCAFGGENLNELYITTANIEPSSDKSEENAGSLFKIEVDGVKGLSSSFYRG